MEKLQFKTVISAPREKIWDLLWNETTYPQWTAPFSEGSRAETDWKTGSKVLFTDGTGMGMVSRISENRAPEFMSIEHLGEVKDGIEDTESDRVKKWAGAHENYTLRVVNGKTELIIDMDITEEFKEMFEKLWPQALEKVKELAEK